MTFPRIASALPLLLLAPLAHAQLQTQPLPPQAPPQPAAIIQAYGPQPVAVAGDTLLIERVNKPAHATPVRGASMAQVQQRFGAPLERLDARGGQKRQWPTINRWRYADFIVYFERDKVIDVVAVQAMPGEVGPRPPIR